MILTYFYNGKIKTIPIIKLGSMGFYSPELRAIVLSNPWLRKSPHYFKYFSGV